MINFQFFNPLKKRSFVRNKNVPEFNPNNSLILNRCAIGVKNVVSKNKFFLSHQTLHLLPLSRNPKPGNIKDKTPENMTLYRMNDQQIKKTANSI